MLKKTIQFENFDGEEEIEEFHFNLSKADLIELDAKYGADGGFVAAIERLTEEQDFSGVIDTMKTIIAMAHGFRSEDGKRFSRDPERTKEFMESNAYSELISELVSDSNAATAFIIGLMPNSLVKAARADGRLSEADGQLVVKQSDETPAKTEEK